MATGTVTWLRWFNETKGFGFITPEDGGDDLFAHYSAIDTAGFQALQEGQKVSFDITADSKRRSRTSLGLGLFIAREIVRGHDGEIGVESSTATGTVFTIRLPRTVEAA